MNLKLLISLFFVMFLQACSDVWLGEAENEIKLTGNRIDLLSGYNVNSNFEEDSIDLEVPKSFSDLAKEWKVDLGTRNSKVVYSPVIDSENVYVLNDFGKVSCINKVSGKRVWEVLVSRKREDTSGITGGGLFVNGNAIYVSTGFGDLLALSKLNGGMIWRYKSIAPFNSAPFVKDNKVFVVNRENETIALNEKDGVIAWKHKGAPEDASFISELKITSYKNNIVPTYTSGEIFVLSSENGIEKVSDELNSISKTNFINSISNITSSNVVVSDKLIASGLGNQTVGIDLTNGRRIWSNRIKAESTPVFKGKYIFLINSNNELMAMSSETGGLFWSVNLNDLSSDIEYDWSSISIYKNNIVLTSLNDKVLFLSALNGEVIFSKNIASSSKLAPIFENNYMYIIGSNGKLYKYSLN
ncbi:MAG: PQQ-like beta-propeller repeat protein [Alphaproteobacteria bacterium]|nr:PQQ-like beta-propeller repeat protein [Alphaproteobacteria bacterium]